MIAQALFFFVVTFLLAAVEIEIEGKYGWAEKLPTWYRATGFLGKLNGGKPLTGYHVFFNAFIVAMFHSCFFLGLEWSLEAELCLVAKYSALVVFWDFLWFVLNPSYGIKNYKRKNIWWFAKNHWLFGIFPVDYLFGLCFSLVFAYFGDELEQQLKLIGLFLALTLITIVLAPLYGRWHGFMRKHDERDRAGIFHTLP